MEWYQNVLDNSCLSVDADVDSYGLHNLHMTAEKNIAFRSVSRSIFRLDLPNDNSIYHSLEFVLTHTNYDDDNK